MTDDQSRRRFKGSLTARGPVQLSRSLGIWRRASKLAIGGGLGFWVANLAISLTPIAAEYRSALSIPYLSMLLEALLGGLLIGFCVAYSLLRFYDKIPTRSPVLKSVALSTIALSMVTLLIEVPAKLFTTTSDPMRYFLIGTVFNGVRILALAIVIGCLYARWNGRVRLPVATSPTESPGQHR